MQHAGFFDTSMLLGSCVNSADISRMIMGAAQVRWLLSFCLPEIASTWNIAMACGWGQCLRGKLGSLWGALYSQGGSPGPVDVVSRFRRTCGLYALELVAALYACITLPLFAPVAVTWCLQAHERSTLHLREAVLSNGMTLSVHLWQQTVPSLSAWA